MFLVLIVLMGACLGSFLNVVIYRLPAGNFFTAGSRSHCPACGKAIAWFDNLPILSWALLLRGKARCCGVGISARYPLVELLTAGLFTLLWWQVIGKTGFMHAASWAASWADGWLWAAFVVKAYFLASLIACAFIDIDHRILPDALTKPMMLVGCLAALFLSWYEPNLDALWFSLAGLGLGLAMTATIRFVAGRIFQQEAMGLGDVKFMGAIGAFLGWQGVLVSFFLGCVFGAIYGVVHRFVTKESQVFFGPFLALGAVLFLFWEAEIMHWLTVTWPRYQHQASSANWLMAVCTFVLLFLLVVIIQRGRTHK